MILDFHSELYLGLNQISDISAFQGLTALRRREPISLKGLIWLKHPSIVPQSHTLHRPESTHSGPIFGGFPAEIDQNRPILAGFSQ